MNTLAKNAKDFGFSHAAKLDVSTLVLREEVREMCAADKCNMYGKCWTCPPACGSLDDCKKKLAAYKNGLLVQYTKSLDDDFDIETMDFAGKKHQQLFYAFYQELKKTNNDVLPLGSGGCRVCKTCTCPNSPCVNPKKAIMSMEAFGLWVSEVCTLNNLPYNHGAKTITYTGCYLF